MSARHGRTHTGGLCEDTHLCPRCENKLHGSGCDLFIHPICGLVACGCIICATLARKDPA